MRIVSRHWEAPVNTPSFNAVSTRHILYLEGGAPTRCAIRRTILARRLVESIPMMVPNLAVTRVEPIDHCTIEDFVRCDDGARFGIHLTTALGQGYERTHAYRVHYDYTQTPVPTREYRAFVPCGGELQEVIVAFDQAHPPARVYRTYWAGPNDGTIVSEEAVAPAALSVRDLENATGTILPCAVAFKKALVPPGTTLGIRWEWQG